MFVNAFAKFKEQLFLYNYFLETCESLLINSTSCARILRQTHA